MLDFLWEYQQQNRIITAQATADRAARVAGEGRYKTDEHERRIDTMALTIMAMWSMLQDRLGVTEAQLIARMQEIDLRDGTLDGKVAPTQSSTCGGCRRVMSTRHRRCIYCGGESLEARPFSGM